MYLIIDVTVACIIHKTTFQEKFPGVILKYKMYQKKFPGFKNN